MNTELVDGNLRAAIQQDQKVARSGNRALAAQALLRMAECYEKLGDAQARAVYQRLVREFADQSDVATSARTRLGAGGLATTASAGMANRRLWTPAHDASFGTVSADGRFLSFTDWSNGDLVHPRLSTGS